MEEQFEKASALLILPHFTEVVRESERHVEHHSVEATLIVRTLHIEGDLLVNVVDTR